MPDFSFQERKPWRKHHSRRCNVDFSLFRAAAKTLRDVQRDIAESSLTKLRIKYSVEAVTTKASKNLPLKLLQGRLVGISWLNYSCT